MYLAAICISFSVNHLFISLITFVEQVTSRIFQFASTGWWIWTLKWEIPVIWKNVWIGVLGKTSQADMNMNTMRFGWSLPLKKKLWKSRFYLKIWRQRIGKRFFFWNCVSQNFSFRRMHVCIYTPGSIYVDIYLHLLLNVDRPYSQLAHMHLTTEILKIGEPYFNLFTEVLYSCYLFFILSA